MNIQDLVTTRTIIMILTVGAIALGFYDASFRDKHLKEIIMTTTAGAFAMMTPRSGSEDK
jgi:hypothetical protein